MSKTKEEVLIQNYITEKDLKGINTHDAILRAMQLYADQCVAERDAEILEWVKNNNIVRMMQMVRSESLIEFIQQPKTEQS